MKSHDDRLNSQRRQIFPGSSFREITSLASSIAEMSHSAFTICITKRSEANNSKKEKKNVRAAESETETVFNSLFEQLREI